MTTLNDLVRASVERHVDRPCVQDTQTALTYGEFFDRASRFASSLTAAGVATGQRVLVSMPNCVDGLVVIVGTLLAGAVVAPTNVLAKRRELVHWAKLVEPRAVVASEGPLGELSGGAGMGEIASVATVVDGSNGGNGSFDLAEAVLKGSPNAGAARVGTDPSFIMFTSGTTGLSKGVTRTHQDYVDYVEQWGRCILRPHEMVMNFLPLNHQAGTLLSFLAPMRMGSTVVLLPKFEPEAFWRTSIDRRINWSLTMPPVPTMLVNADAQPPAGHMYRETLGGGGSADWTAFEQTYGIGMITGYGSTETTMVTMSPTARAAGASRMFPDGGGGFCGPTVPGWIELRVTRSDGDRADAGEVGEIQLQGASLFREYWNNPEATAKAFTADGWFKTGDLGYLNHLGDLYFLGRSGDRIRRNSENIDPVEIETVLKEHPAVADAGVVGIPDRLRGEEVLACVVVRPGATVSFDQLVAHCAENLAKFKIPRYFEFRSELSKTTGTFRVQRTVLREEANPAAWYDRFATD